MIDLESKLDVVQSIKPAAVTATATGASVDLRRYASAMVVINPGTVTDGTHTPKVQDSPDDSTWTDLPASKINGTLAAIATDTVQKVGIRTSENYVRVVSTVAGATTGGVYSASVVRGNAEQSPL